MKRITNPGMEAIGRRAGYVYEKGDKVFWAYIGVDFSVHCLDGTVEGAGTETATIRVSAKNRRRPDCRRLSQGISVDSREAWHGSLEEALHCLAVLVAVEITLAEEKIKAGRSALSIIGGMVGVQFELQGAL